MDDLDKQLAELQLMNSRDLSPKPLVPPMKKVGPAVPPKPVKKATVQPNLQRNDYSNMKLTLDNPAILEQKLEALEHHKRVLENQKRRQVIEGSGGGGFGIAAKLSHGNDISAGSAVASGGGGGIIPPPAIYSNVQPKKTAPRSDAAAAAPELIYSNIMHGGANMHNIVGGAHPIHPASGQNNHHLYSAALGYGQDDLPPPPPPLEIPAPLNLADVSVYHQSGGGGAVAGGGGGGGGIILHHLSEDELPPPPSPVSSSYSELRRATDNTYGGISGVPGGGGGGGGIGHSGLYSTINSGHHPTYQQLNPQPNGGGGGVVVVGSVGRQPMARGVLSAGTNGGPIGSQTYANSYHHPDYRNYVPSSQSSSTYESIYEPINPRPPSQMSSRSNYSLYTPYVSGGSGGGGGGVGPQTKHLAPCQKEAEVDALTDLLVRSMDNSNDIDSYGICVQCGERVVGENSGCTAMEQIYHIACFTCCQCQINLQGKPFYALDGKPCCEDDYLNTLEKCSVCMKPILERILRATGKPYHPGCFCCVVCGKSLDGVPFTVDATNQNHCIEDFHKKFAPRCCVCLKPIMPEPGEEETVRVVALDRSFHVSCYKCEDCGLLLSSEAEGRGCFPLDDHILCKSCNAKRVQALTSHMSTEL